MYKDHNTDYHTTSSKPYEPFLAMWQGRHDGLQPIESIDHKEYGTMMIIGSEEGVTYITKLQAMKFFGLIDPAT